MSVRKLLYLVCTACNNQFYSDTGDHYDESAWALRARAREVGWRYRRVWHGGFWDLCPRCDEKHTMERFRLQNAKGQGRS